MEQLPVGTHVVLKNCADANINSDFNGTKAIVESNFDEPISVQGFTMQVEMLEKVSHWDKGQQWHVKMSHVEPLHPEPLELEYESVITA